MTSALRIGLLALSVPTSVAKAWAGATVVDVERHSPLDRVEVVLIRVDGAAVDRSTPQHELTAGSHRLELRCITHQPGGMAEFTVLSTLEQTVDLADGGSYPLVGHLDDQNRCTPAIGAAQTQTCTTPAAPTRTQ